MQQSSEQQACSVIWKIICVYINIYMCMYKYYICCIAITTSKRHIEAGAEGAIAIDKEGRMEVVDWCFTTS